MNQTYDVIIIGAGPSGSSCAYNIKRFSPNTSVLLLDKAEFPRYKPCGGGISPEVSNYFDFDLSPGIDMICNDVVMIAQGREVTSEQYPLWMVRREKFDAFLLEKAKEKGVAFISSCDVSAIDSENTVATRIQTNQGEFTGKLIVLAEGGRGKLAKKLGFNNHSKPLAAMEYEHYTRELNHKLYIDFDYNENGYAWNFPKSDGLSLGIGGYIKGQGKDNVKLPQKLRNYTTQFNVDEFDKKYLHGHPIVMYSGKKSLIQRNIILIGEIAGCVDPLTAEGIRPAIKSGFLAAKAIANYMQSHSINDLLNYNHAFHREIGSDFRYARVLSYFVNKYLHKIMPLLTTKTALNSFMGVFSGKSTYKENMSIRRVGKLLLKMI